jgi:imidazole glycerol-phosphate synthase subunit HisH
MLTIVDFKTGNLRNIQKAFLKLGEEVSISQTREQIESASGYILPGVGSFASAMNNLDDLKIIDSLKDNILKNKKPILGICLGMQILAEVGYEDGITKGLGVLPMEVKKLTQLDGYPIPHIGWNDIEYNPKSVLFNDTSQNSDYYFVHSFHAICADKEIISASCEYGTKFVAAVEKNHIFGTQFHPEKSQNNGFKVLQNFISFHKSNLKSA